MNDNPFQLFDIPEKYAIDLSQVNDKYLALQKQFHPDNFASRTVKEKLMATQISANLVAAHKTLLDPIMRATKLINLSGMAFSLEEFISRDKMLLMQQMELREQLESALAAELPALKQQFETDFSTLEEQLVSELAEKQLESAAETVLKMRYYQKLLIELAHKISHS